MMGKISGIIVMATLFLAAGCEKPADDLIETTPNFEVDDSNLSDSLRAVLWEQANQISIRNIYDCDSPLTDSILIPADSAQCYYFALVNIYNAESVAARDTVFEVFPFSYFADYELHMLLAVVDSSQPWIPSWLDGDTLTGVQQLDVLMKQYDLTVSHVYDWTSSSGEYGFLLHTDLMVNSMALASRLSALPVIAYCEPDGWFGDGDRVLGRRTSQAILIDFVKGWGDCPAGCTNMRTWQFQVSFQGNVSYLGSFGNDPGSD